MAVVHCVTLSRSAMHSKPHVSYTRMHLLSLLVVLQKWM